MKTLFYPYVVLLFLVPAGAAAQSTDTVRLDLRLDTLCAGGAQLTARREGTAYRWTTTDTTRSIAVDRSGTYTAFITLADGSTVVDPREVVLQFVPDPVRPVPDVPPPYCEGQRITYSVSLTGYDSIQWNDGRGTVTPGFGPDNRRATFTFRVGGGVSYIAYYGRCRETLTVLPPLPFDSTDLGTAFTATLIADTTELCAGDSVTLRIRGRQIARVEWVDGNTDTVRTLVADPDVLRSATVFSACSDSSLTLSPDLTVTDCDTIAAGPCTVVLPQLISPNGDGRNDIFTVFTDCELGDFTLLVFNRWGQSVAELTPDRPGWDGRSDGIPQRADLYLYKLVYELADADAIPQTRTGSFHLVR